MSKTFALFDCNNFYVSCERVFNPKLEGKPVVVLSSNDGCIIARSNEAKEFGIPMGAPVFKWRSVIEQNRVHIYSANFALYGDFSDRVMSVLGQHLDNLEVYSIDEAFALFDREPQVTSLVHHVRQRVKQWTGIPVSVGVGPTKTLAKLANVWAKKHPELGGVVNLDEYGPLEKLLAQVPVDKVWGIGRRYTKFLNRYGIFTALQFRDRPDAWIKEHMTILGLRTAWELRGISCIPFERERAPQKSMVCSRSFGEPIVEKRQLWEAVAYFTTRVGEDLRKQGLIASSISVFITTSRFISETYYANSASQTLVIPTHFTPTLLQAARTSFDRIFRPGYRYKKAGVMVTGLKAQHDQQLSLEQIQAYPSQEANIMDIIDTLNKEWGKDTLRFASLGVARSLNVKQVHKSKRYTTSWLELPEVRI